MTIGINDWLNISNQALRIGQDMRRNDEIGRQKNLEHQAGEMTNYFIENPDALVGMGPQGSDPNAIGEKPAQGLPFASADPQALAAARLNAIDFFNKKMLNDERSRKALFEKTAMARREWRNNITMANSVAESGDNMAALSLVADANNQFFKDNKKWGVDADGSMVVKDPTGRSKKLNIDAKKLISSIMNSSPFQDQKEYDKAMVAAASYRQKMNRKSLSKYEVVQDDDGNTLYVTDPMIDEYGNVSRTVWTSIPFAPGSKKVKELPVSAKSVEERKVETDVRSGNDTKYVELVEKSLNLGSSENQYTGQTTGMSGEQKQEIFQTMLSLGAVIQEIRGKKLSPMEKFSIASNLMKEAANSAEKAWLEAQKSKTPPKDHDSFVHAQKMRILSDGINKILGDIKQKSGGGQRGAAQDPALRDVPGAAQGLLEGGGGSTGADSGQSRAGGMDSNLSALGAEPEKPNEQTAASMDTFLNNKYPPQQQQPNEMGALGGQGASPAMDSYLNSNYPSNGLTPLQQEIQFLTGEEDIMAIQEQEYTLKQQYPNASEEELTQMLNDRRYNPPDTAIGQVQAR